MRLDQRQVAVLRRAATRWFGAGSGLWLFGSRACDDARGGDIDLYIETDEVDADRLIDQRLRFLADLHDTPEFDGERIDVVIRSPLHRDELPVHRIARLQGVPLC